MILLGTWLGRVMVISFKYGVNKGEKKARNACSGVKSDVQNGRVSKLGEISEGGEG